MFRSGLIPFLALALAPAAAQAAPRALGPADHVALSGDAAVLTAGDKGTVTVTRAPLDGTATTKLLRTPGHAIEVTASDERVAVRVATTKGDRVYAGPATGPLAAVETPKDLYAVDVTGDTVMLLGDKAVVALAPDGSRRTLAFPERAAALEFGGDFVAYTERKPNEAEDSPTGELRERNWRTGETVRSVDFGEAKGITDTDVREDGGLLLELDDGRMHTLLPGEDLRDIGKDPSRETGATHRWAGGGYTVRTMNPTAVFHMPTSVSAGGARTDFGLPSEAVEDLDSDGQTAVWQANGCAITAPVAGPLAHRYTGSSCRLSEAVVEPPYRKARHHSVRVTVRCLVSTSARCRGEVRAPELRRAVRVSIPTGKTRTVPLPLRRKAKEVLHLRFALRGGRVGESLYPLR